MRCSNCGMPLSPIHTQCPRCGTPRNKLGGKIRLARPTPSSPQAPLSPLQNPPVVPVAQSWDISPLPPPSLPVEDQLLFPGQEGEGNAPLATIPSTPPLFSSEIPPQAAIQLPTTDKSHISGIPMQMQMQSTNTQAGSLQTRKPPRTKLGFTVAGACMALSAGILVFVYILTQNPTLMGSLTPQTNTTTVNHNQKTQNDTAPLPTITPTANAATPTPTASSAQYIDNVRLTTAVNTATGEPIDQRAVFHIGQPIYVTLTLHPLAYNGAVCLKWTVNAASIPYNTQVGSSPLAQTNAYFYFKPQAIGNGSVEVSWSATTACINTLPIQRIPFQVQ
jgi:hypothetical protein